MTSLNDYVDVRQLLPGWTEKTCWNCEETCGGGIVVDVLDNLEGVQYRVLIDQYAMGDPYESIDGAEA